MHAKLTWAQVDEIRSLAGAASLQSLKGHHGLCPHERVRRAAAVLD
jgi:hypothetical protein